MAVVLAKARVEGGAEAKAQALSMMMAMAIATTIAMAVAVAIAMMMVMEMAMAMRIVDEALALFALDAGFVSVGEWQLGASGASSRAGLGSAAALLDGLLSAALRARCVASGAAAAVRAGANDCAGKDAGEVTGTGENEGEWGPISRAAAEARLEERPPGTFLLRRKDAHCLVLSVVDKAGRPKHALIESNGGGAVAAGNLRFDSLEACWRSVDAIAKHGLRFRYCPETATHLSTEKG
eukprot:g402.t1